ncbi:nitrogen fixation protein NifM [Stutzerimonas azotifigens]|uniref:nitrogen fixation protein NifM n=1 Tax=Stutzerimonas azotifigens TaxID=291995 RepID=UPI000426B877|nr:nitrogen fixation protein NifM [Stutzerimonas azotifigens]
MSIDPVAGGARYQLLKVAHERFGCAPAALSTPQREQAERIADRQLQLEDAVLHSPEACGVVIPPEQVDDAWAAIVSRYETPDELHRALDDSGLDEAGLRRLLARELKVETVLQRVCTGLPEITDTDVSLYYFNHPERFVRPATRRARHILITVNEAFPENTRASAWRRINQIAGRLRRKPRRFAEQALKHSECPSAMDGGSLGLVRPGVLYAQLEACLFGLGEGEIGPVVESPLGFHLVFCEAIHPAGQMSLQEVLPHLRERLQARQCERHQRAWLAGLLQSAPTPVETLPHE